MTLKLKEPRFTPIQGTDTAVIAAPRCLTNETFNPCRGWASRLLLILALTGCAVDNSSQSPNGGGTESLYSHMWRSVKIPANTIDLGNGVWVVSGVECGADETLTDTTIVVADVPAIFNGNNPVCAALVGTYTYMLTGDTLTICRGSCTDYQ